MRLFFRGKYAAQLPFITQMPFMVLLAGAALGGPWLTRQAATQEVAKQSQREEQQTSPQAAQNENQTLPRQTLLAKNENAPPVNTAKSQGKNAANTVPAENSPAPGPYAGNNNVGNRGRGGGRVRVNARQQRLEEELRRAMISLGCQETSVQDIVLAYIREETKARRPLVEQSRRLFLMLRIDSPTSGPPVSTTPKTNLPDALPEPVAPGAPANPVEDVDSDANALEEAPQNQPAEVRSGNNVARNAAPATAAPEQKVNPDEANAGLAAQVAMYRQALEADRVRHQAAEDALDKKIKFSENPRLEAMLLLMGVIGDSPNLPLRGGLLGGATRQTLPRNTPPIPPRNMAPAGNLNPAKSR